MTSRTITSGDIGEGQREWEFEPLEVPTPVEVPETAPAEPEPVPA
ncbi:hypothetical protein GCM10009616_36040 [Microlunatus lacustris]